jgi:hypothetical protein
MAKQENPSITRLALRAMCLVAVAKGKVSRNDWTVFGEVLAAAGSSTTQAMLREEVLNTCRSLKGAPLTDSAEVIAAEIKGIKDAGWRRQLIIAIGTLSAGITQSEARQVVELLIDSLRRSESSAESARSEDVIQSCTEIALRQTSTELTVESHAESHRDQFANVPELEPNVPLMDPAQFAFQDGNNKNASGSIAKTPTLEPTSGYWECPRCGSQDVYVGSTTVARQGGMLLHEIGDTGFIAAHAVGGGSEIVDAVKCRRCGELLVGDRDYRRSLYEIALEEQHGSQAVGTGCLVALIGYAVVMLGGFWLAPGAEEPVLLMLHGGFFATFLAAGLYALVMRMAGYDLRNRTRLTARLNARGQGIFIMISGMLVTFVIAAVVYFQSAKGTPQDVIVEERPSSEKQTPTAVID